MTKKAERFFENYLASPQGQAAMATVESAIVGIYRAQVVAEFGERCADVEAECCVCQAWARFDAWSR